MAGENEGASAQALWDELVTEREAEPSDSFDLAGEPELNAESSPDPLAEEVTTEVVTKPAEQGAAPDPFEGLSPAVIERLNRLDALEQQVAGIPQLLQTVKTAEGRVAAMQREFDQAKSAAKAVGDAPTAAQIAAAKASTEKWDSLKDDFPEWAEATEQFVKASLAGIKPAEIQQIDPSQIEAMVNSRLAAERAETAKLIEEAKVEGKHPTWRADVNTPEFVQWHGVQPAEVQKLAESTKGSDAIRMLDLFYDAKSKSAEQVAAGKQSRLAAAAGKRPGSSTPTSKTVDTMSPAELWDYERRRLAEKAELTGLTY